MIDRHDDVVPLYRVMLTLGLVAIVILASGFALLLRFAPPGESTGVRARITGVFVYDPATGSVSGPPMTRFRRDEPFAAKVDWTALPAGMLVGARWTDSLDDDAGTIAPTTAGGLALRDAPVPVRVQPQFHAYLPGQYTLTIVRYSRGQPVELLASARVTVLRYP